MTLEFEINYTDVKAINTLDSELNQIDGVQIDKFDQNGFDGLDIVFYFIATGGAVSLLKSISKIIVKILARDDVKSFKYKNIECKGYTEKEVEKLLEKVSDLQSEK